MNTVNRVAQGSQVQGIKKNSESQADSNSVTGLKDRASGIKSDAFVAAGADSLLNDPRLMEQAGMGQIAAIMANLQGSGSSRLAQGVMNKVAERSEEISLAA